MEKSITFLFLCLFYARFRAVRSDILFIHDYFYKYVLNTMFFLAGNDIKNSYGYYLYMFGCDVIMK